MTSNAGFLRRRVFQLFLLPLLRFLERLEALLIAERKRFFAIGVLARLQRLEIHRGVRAGNR